MVLLQGSKKQGKAVNMREAIVKWDRQLHIVIDKEERWLSCTKDHRDIMKTIVFIRTYQLYGKLFLSSLSSYIIPCSLNDRFLSFILVRYRSILFFLLVVWCSILVLPNRHMMMYFCVPCSSYNVVFLFLVVPTRHIL